MLTGSKIAITAALLMASVRSMDRKEKSANTVHGCPAQLPTARVHEPFGRAALIERGPEHYGPAVHEYYTPVDIFLYIFPFDELEDEERHHGDQRHCRKAELLAQEHPAKYGHEEDGRLPRTRSSLSCRAPLSLFLITPCALSTPVNVNREEPVQRGHTRSGA